MEKETFRIAAIGSIYLDVNCLDFPVGDGLLAERETVGPGYVLSPGGSAVNFARMATSLGIAVDVIAKVGDDLMAGVLVDLLERQGVGVQVIRSSDVQTNLGLNFVSAAGQTIMTSAGSANASMSVDDASASIQQLLGANLDYLYFGSCLKLPAVVQSMLNLHDNLSRTGTKLVLDHGRVTNAATDSDIMGVRKLVGVADVYLPSRDELMAVWGHDTVEGALLDAASNCPGIVVVKDSSRGALTAIEGEVVRTPPFVLERVFTTVGAGDSFNAGLIKALAHGSDLEDAVVHACATAALHVSGNVPTHDAVEALVATCLG